MKELDPNNDNDACQHSDIGNCCFSGYKIDSLKRVRAEVLKKKKSRKMEYSKKKKNSLKSTSLVNLGSSSELVINKSKHPKTSLKRFSPDENKIEESFSENSLSRRRNNEDEEYSVQKTKVFTKATIVLEQRKEKTNIQKDFFEFEDEKNSKMIEVEEFNKNILKDSKEFQKNSEIQTCRENISKTENKKKNEHFNDQSSTLEFGNQLPHNKKVDFVLVGDPFIHFDVTTTWYAWRIPFTNNGNEKFIEPNYFKKEWEDSKNKEKYRFEGPLPSFSSRIQTTQSIVPSNSTLNIPKKKETKNSEHLLVSDSKMIHSDVSDNSKSVENHSESQFECNNHFNDYYKSILNYNDKNFSYLNKHKTCHFPRKNNNEMNSNFDAERLCTVFIGDLPIDSNEKELRKLCDPYGTILRIKTFPRKSYAFIRYANNYEAQTAIDHLHDVLYRGCRLRLGRGGRRLFCLGEWKDSDSNHLGTISREEEEDPTNSSFDDQMKLLKILTK